ncbi:DUF1932 domain-containing protein [Streptomyces sp. NPDC000405]|uniref:NAD(P)-dependent oxidoreductase n=1 Tax=Streptomyces sp. NPDC000405 TaxID=3161033 RepID=UPI00398C8E23
MTTTITLLHPGSMGAAIGAQAVHAGHRVLWVPEGRSDATRKRAEAAGLTAALSLRAALEECDLVLSVCPPAAASQVAAEVDELGFQGLFVDANAVNPERVISMRDTMKARVLDGSIIGPPPTGQKSARLYVSGHPEGIARIAGLFAGTTVEVGAAGDDVGAASALKMAFASYQKTARTTAAVAHALAAAHGVGDLLIQEAQRMPAAILSDPGYLPSVAARGWRWKDEMHDIAVTLRSAGLPADIAEATASVLGRWDGDKDRTDMPLDEVFDHLHTSPGGY